MPLKQPGAMRLPCRGPWKRRCYLWCLMWIEAYLYQEEQTCQNACGCCRGGCSLVPWIPKSGIARAAKGSQEFRNEKAGQHSLF